MRGEWLHKRIKLQTRIRFGRPTLAIQRRPPEVYLLQSFCQFVNILIFGTLVATVNVQSSGSGDTSGGCPTNLNCK